jgi:ferredoxin
VASPFEILGLDPSADDDEIIEAYRRRVKEVHPDQGGSKEAFTAVRDAYEQLMSGDVTTSGPAGPGEPGETGGPNATATRGGPRAQSTDEAQQIESHVEYLNYMVAEDNGWELGDENLFGKAARAGLSDEDHGEFTVLPHESLLEAAERRGFAWPFACRGGACTNCAVMVVEGDIPTPSWQILPEDLTDRGIRLSCNSAPVTPEAKIIYNVKHLPGVDELRLPATRFKKARSDD